MRECVLHISRVLCRITKILHINRCQHNLYKRRHGVRMYIWDTDTFSRRSQQRTYNRIILKGMGHAPC